MFKKPQALFADLACPYPISIGVVHAGDWASSVPDRLTAEGRMGVIVDEDPKARIVMVDRHANPGGHHTAREQPEDWVALGFGLPRGHNERLGNRGRRVVRMMARLCREFLFTPEREKIRAERVKRRQ